MSFLAQRIAALAAAGLLLIPLQSSRAAPFVSCSIQFGAINFGQLSSKPERPVDSSTTISGRCSGQATLRISLGSGRNASFDRALTKGDARLRYNLYLDAPRSTVWGDGTRGTQAQMVRVAGSFSFTVFGRILPNQAVPAGAYTDDLLITVEY